MRIAPSQTVIAVYAHSWVVVCTSGPRAIPGSTSARLPCAARSWTISPPMPGPSSWSLFEPATHDVEELVGSAGFAALRHSGCSLRIVGQQHLRPRNRQAPPNHPCAVPAAASRLNANQFALVIDEHGGVAGIVTLDAVLK